MQDPQPLKGLLFPAKQLNYYIPTFQEEYETSMGYVDVADEGSDHLSAPVGRHIGSKVYIPEVIFNKENTDVTLPQVQDLFTRHQVRYARVESNNMGAMYGRSLAKMIPKHKCNSLTTGLINTRILTYAAFIRKHFWFVHPDYQTPQYKSLWRSYAATWRRLNCKRMMMHLIAKRPGCLHIPNVSAPISKFNLIFIFIKLFYIFVKQHDHFFVRPGIHFLQQADSQTIIQWHSQHLSTV